MNRLFFFPRELTPYEKVRRIPKHIVMKSASRAHAGGAYPSNEEIVSMADDEYSMLLKDFAESEGYESRLDALFDEHGTAGESVSAAFFRYAGRPSFDKEVLMRRVGQYRQSESNKNQVIRLKDYQFPVTRGVVDLLFAYDSWVPDPEKTIKRIERELEMRCYLDYGLIVVTYPGQHSHINLALGQVSSVISSEISDIQLLALPEAKLLLLNAFLQGRVKRASLDLLHDRNIYGITLNGDLEQEVSTFLRFDLGLKSLDLMFRWLAGLNIFASLFVILVGLPSLSESAKGVIAKWQPLVVAIQVSLAGTLLLIGLASVFGRMFFRWGYTRKVPKWDTQ